MYGKEGDLKGLVPLMNEGIFKRVTDEVAEHPEVEYFITVAYLEIYQEVLTVSFAL